MNLHMLTLVMSVLAIPAGSHAFDWDLQYTADQI